MFNFIGKHKIGILGDANSGKTVFLTSLLWNLKERKLKLGAENKAPTDVKIHDLKDEHAFDYAGNKRKCKNSNKWPAKTVDDYSLAKCSYRLEDSFFQRDLTFVDIPGERMADLLIWQCVDYEEWSEEMLRSWRESDIISTYMQDYVGLLSDENSTGEQLSWEYKKGMRHLINNYIPQISPSTLIFDNGKAEAPSDIDNDSWLKKRSIWRHDDQACDFFPLPTDWRDWNKELYESCENNYELYRRKVIKPLFSQIGSCDHFIICIDVLGILAQSPGNYLKVKEELEYFFNKITPSFWRHLWDRIGRNPMRIAFVATKSDLVYGDNLEHLKDLLKDLVTSFVTEKIDFGYFTCTAWTSTKEGEGEYQGLAVATILEEDGNGKQRQADVVLKCPPLPEEWPPNWKGEQYAHFLMEMLPSVIIANPPKQTGIDDILNFVTGDGKE
ncbi:MAG: YcjX family protein [Victivallales bacterium]|nr:YcjX family protein [Victivallales bacterium]